MARRLTVDGNGVDATSVRTLIASGKPGIIRDDRLPGFMARLNTDGSVSFILEYRAGRGRGFPVRRIVIANVKQDGKGGIERGLVSIAEARARASDIKAKAIDERAPLEERDPLHVRRKEAAKIAAERAAPTVSEILTAYLDDKVAQTNRPRTLQLYRSYAGHLEREIGAVKAKDLTVRRVTLAHRAIASHQGRDLKVTANRCVALLRASINWSIKQGTLPKTLDNVAREVDRYEEDADQIRALDADQLARLGEALARAETEGLPYTVDESKPNSKHAPKPANRVTRFDAYAVAGIRLLALTALRLREVLHLEWSAVDLDRGELILPKTKTKRRIVPLGAPALAVLSALPRIGKYVIASTTAGTANERPRADLNRPWLAIRRAAGLDGVRLHDLRHTAASLGVGAGLGLQVVGGLLGHRNARTTQRYAHVGMTPMRAAADRMSTEVADAMGLMPAAPGAEIVPIGARRR
ncbi:MAG: site-specific integrase [Hyphomicrobiaceae bacterium]|nr:site-specific integrase [Hyphomicrobiaceae bacterium]